MFDIALTHFLHADLAIGGAIIIAGGALRWSVGAVTRALFSLGPSVRAWPKGG